MKRQDTGKNFKTYQIMDMDQQYAKTQQLKKIILIQKRAESLNSDLTKKIER